MLRLATTARFPRYFFYVTIGKKSKSVKSTTYSVVTHLHVFRDTSFFALILHERNRSPTGLSPPSHIRCTKRTDTSRSRICL